MLPDENPQLALTCFAAAVALCFQLLDAGQAATVDTITRLGESSGLVKSLDRSFIRRATAFSALFAFATTAFSLAMIFTGVRHFRH